MQVYVSSWIRTLHACGNMTNEPHIGQDKGGADLIADGRIKVRSGVSPERFSETGIVLSDHTELPADVVIFA